MNERTRFLVSTTLICISVVLFVLSAFDWGPKDWTVNLARLGLAFFAASIIPRVWAP